MKAAEPQALGPKDVAQSLVFKDPFCIDLADFSHSTKNDVLKRPTLECITFCFKLSTNEY